MEWLALELVIEARHVLLERLGNDDCALWSMLDDQFKCSRRNLHLSFASLGFRPLPATAFSRASRRQKEMV